MSTVPDTLRFGRGLDLPPGFVTQTYAFLGKRGSGKTYAATKLAELMLDAGAPIVALDPVGIWYGLRLNEAKTGPSPYQIPVLGGLHGDIPLEATAGKLIADLVVDRGVSVVLDVSQFESDADKARFATEFGARFFFRQKGQPRAVHLFIEECQEFVPQNPQREETRMLHVYNRMVKLGRNFGIGVSFISQRPQEVNKKALNMAEVLLAFQMTGVKERDAIEEWAVEQGVDEDVASLSERLPFFEVGTAHVWSPQWLQIAKDVHILKKRTADVSSTPQLGDVMAAVKPLAPIDLEQLRGAMAATIEKAKTEDPKEWAKERATLQRRVRELETQTQTQKTAADPETTARAVEKAVERALAETHRAHLKTVGKLRHALEDAMKFVVNVTTQNFDIAGADKEAIETAVRAAVERAMAVVDARLESRARHIEQIRLQAQRMATLLEAAMAQGDDEVAVSVNVVKNEPFSVTPAKAAPPAPARTPRVASTPRALTEGVTRSQQKILDALALLERLGISPATTIQMAIFAGYTENGHFDNLRGALRTAGLIEYPGGGTVQLTEAGRAAAHADDIRIESLADLHQIAHGKTGASAGKLLQVLLDAYPKPLPVAEVARRAGYTENGHFDNLRGRLRTLGFADYSAPGHMVATDLLFPAGLR